MVSIHTNADAQELLDLAREIQEQEPLLPWSFWFWTTTRVMKEAWSDKGSDKIVA